MVLPSPNTLRSSNVSWMVFLTVFVSLNISSARRRLAHNSRPSSYLPRRRLLRVPLNGRTVVLSRLSHNPSPNQYPAPPPNTVLVHVHNPVPAHAKPKLQLDLDPEFSPESQSQISKQDEGTSPFAHTLPLSNPIYLTIFRKEFIGDDAVFGQGRV